MSEFLAERQNPDGFHPHASGLLVPEDKAREREVWTRDEWRLMDRIIRLMRARNLAIVLHCHACKGQEIEVVNQPVNGFTWRCDHKDRIFHRQV